MSVKFDEMPTWAQAAYCRENEKRRKILVAAWIVLGVTTVVFTVVFMCSMPENGFFDMLSSAFVFGVLFAALMQGLVHLGRLLKSIWKNGIALSLLLGIFILLLCAVVLMFIWYAGVVFLAIDTILFFLKKPLIYPFENKRFLEAQ